MPSNTYLIIGICAFLGLLLLWRGFSNLLTSDLHKLRGMFQLVISVLLLCFSSVVGIASINLSTYKNLTNETELATITFEELKHDKGRFIATLSIKGDLSRSYELQGDQWQIDARVIKWNNELLQFGFSPLYQFDRLSGRYSDIEMEKIAEQTPHDLLVQKGIDIWSLAQKFEHAISSMIDTTHGSSTYQPMSHNSSYSISLGNQGLISRPIE